MSDHDRLKYLEAALREIAEGKGRYNPNQLKHADNCIEDMKQIALDALVGKWEKEDNE